MLALCHEIQYVYQFRKLLCGMSTAMMITALADRSHPKAELDLDWKATYTKGRKTER